MVCQQLRGDEGLTRSEKENAIHARYAEDLFRRGEYDAAMVRDALPSCRMFGMMLVEGDFLYEGVVCLK